MEPAQTQEHDKLAVQGLLSGDSNRDSFLDDSYITMVDGSNQGGFVVVSL